MDPLTPVTEIASVLPSRLTGEQQQRLPFTQGQMLHGTITAKEGKQQFTLEINGQLLTAHANANLQVGQRLNLQVSSLTPQIELQIVTNDPVNRHIKPLLPLLGQQSLLATELADLGGNAELMQRLGATSQETFRLYAQDLSQLTLQPRMLKILQTTEGTALLDRPETALPSLPQQETLQAMGDLFRQLARDPALAPNTALLSLDLAELFTQAASKKEPPSSLQILSTATLPGDASVDTLLSAMLEKIQGNPALNTPSTAMLLSLIGKTESLPAADRLLQLLTLLTPLEQGQSVSQSQGIGLQLAEQLNRLGLDMERLLLEGKPEEAARTLKFALLEAVQSGIKEERHSISAERLVHNLELHQLLQLRLAGQALFFLPLPFSFLQQGYLLIDRDQSGGQEEGSQEQSRQPVQTASLHLQLEGLGNLHIDISRSENQITLKFLTEHTEQAKFLAGFREELESRLTGGTLVAAQFLVGAKEPVKALLARILGDNTGVIDTSV